MMAFAIFSTKGGSDRSRRYRDWTEPTSEATRFL